MIPIKNIMNVQYIINNDNIYILNVQYIINTDKYIYIYNECTISLLIPIKNILNVQYIINND